MAILPDLVNGIDAVCVVLAVKRNSFINRARKGDVVIGINSWGLHANGYTLARKVIEDRIEKYSVIIDGWLSILVKNSLDLLLYIPTSL